MPATAGEVLEHLYPGFQWPLEIAIGWLRDGDPQKLKEAIALLRGLRKNYPDAPQVGQWLVLALIENRQPKEAETVLDETERLFRYRDEELLCRWGRLFREQGDQNLADVAEDETNRETAILLYRKARDKYEEAATVRKGHYPLINVAELSLTLAGLVDASHREEELARAETVARACSKRGTSGPWTCPTTKSGIWPQRPNAK